MTSHKFTHIRNFLIISGFFSGSHQSPSFAECVHRIPTGNGYTQPRPRFYSRYCVGRLDRGSLWELFCQIRVCTQPARNLKKGQRNGPVHIDRKKPTTISVFHYFKKGGKALLSIIHKLMMCFPSILTFSILVFWLSVLNKF